MDPKEGAVLFVTLPSFQAALGELGATSTL